MRQISADIKAIKSVSEQLVEAYEARNWNAFAEFFTADGIWMPPGVAPLHGKDEWWAWVKPRWNDSTVVQMTLSSEEIVVTGDWAFERHIERQDMIFGSGGAPTSYYFRGIWILRRQKDGPWKIARYIWNKMFLLTENQTDILCPDPLLSGSKP